MKESFIKPAFESFFNTPTRKDIISGDFTKAYNYYDTSSEADRQKGLFTTYGEFFGYLAEILQNEINITYIIERYTGEIEELFDCIPLNTKSTRGMTKAKMDFLFSVLTGLKSTPAGNFLKFVEKYTEDREAIGEFMQTYADINRFKQTVNINRASLQKEAKKMFKTQNLLGKMKYDKDTEINLTAKPRCNVLWFDANKRSKVATEVREKLSLEAKRLKESYHPYELLYSKTHTKLPSILKSNCIKSTPFLIRIYSDLISLVDNHQDEPEEATGSTSLVSLIGASMTPLYLYSVIVLDNFNSSKSSELNNAKSLLSTIQIFVEKFSNISKDNSQFKDFKQKIRFFCTKYLDSEANNDEMECEDDEAEAEKRKEKKAKMLAKRKKKMKSRFSKKNKKFMEKLFSVTDDIVEEMNKEISESKSSCIADNSTIPTNEPFYILAEASTSNVSHNLIKK